MNTRHETSIETDYQAELRTLWIGLEYRGSDSGWFADISDEEYWRLGQLVGFVACTECGGCGRCGECGRCEEHYGDWPIGEELGACEVCGGSGRAPAPPALAVVR